ncbi:unnamed protein product [Anisakis simplex]|uniref:Putative beta-1,4-galactosyltransferase (inferred by orthology to a S. mansoni protein) n=1 Tax=Anisakis simplex TaxID=6269 RepID=A0A0M3K0B5_ANISI|nr:unnamed protein product [Anisakis simplex]
MAITLPSCSSKLLSMLNGTDSYELLSAVDESVTAMCGIHVPQDCDPDEKIAILIPYRNRYSQLQILLSYLLEFLSKFRTRFAIFIIEPTDGQVFNRGKLFNIGYNLANTIEDWDCFFFHDVDLLPTNRQLPYRCPRNGTVQHWSSAIDKDGFKLPYGGYIGGVSAMNTEDFLMINGYPNEFWGWGGEDDCFGYRLAFTLGELFLIPFSFAWIVDESSSMSNVIDKVVRCGFDEKLPAEDMHYSVHGSKLEVVRAPNSTYTMLRHGSNEKGNEKNPFVFKILADVEKQL